MMNPKLALLLCLAWLPTTVLAEPDTTIENVIVTGSRLQHSVESLPSHVTIIDRETLLAMPNRTVLDALRNVAGLHVHQFGGRGGVTSVFIRGAEPNFTIVLIDGVKVNDPNDTRGGSFNFATLNLSEIERIEIVRGARSAVYGSDALAGIINIVTRSTTEQGRAVLEAEVGEDGYFRGAAHASGNLGGVAEFSLTAAGANDGDQIPLNDFEDTNVSGRLRLSSIPGTTILLSGRYSDASSKALPEDSGGPRLAVIRDTDTRDQEQSSFAGNVGYEISPRTTLNLRVRFAGLDMATTSPGVAPGVRDGVPPTRTNATLDRFNAGVDVAFKAADWLSVAAGIGYEDEKGEQVGSLDLAPGFSLPTDFALDRDISSAFVETRLGRSRGPMALLALRRDDPSNSESETTLRIGLQHRFQRNRVFTTWSEGYKLPSFFALGHPLVGNSDLRPESSTSFEIGVTHEAADDQLRVTIAAFYNEYEDLIDFDPDLFTTVNRTRATNRGAEIAIRAKAAENIFVSGHLTHVDIDVSDHTVLRQRPDWRGGISVDWNATSEVNVAANWIYSGETFDSSIPTGGVDLDAYDRLDLEVRWQPAASLTLWFAIDNCLDEEYEEAVGFPSLARSARAGIRFRF